jgi:hypothetical protein
MSKSLLIKRNFGSKGHGLGMDRRKGLPIFQQKNEISADYHSFKFTPSRKNQGKGLYSK